MRKTAGSVKVKDEEGRLISATKKDSSTCFGKHSLQTIWLYSVKSLKMRSRRFRSFLPSQTARTVLTPRPDVELAQTVLHLTPGAEVQVHGNSALVAKGSFDSHRLSYRQPSPELKSDPF